MQPIPICDPAASDGCRLAARVLRDMNDGLLVLTPQGYILFCNGYAARMLGLNGEAAGQSYAALLGDGGAGGPQAGTFTGSFYMYYCNDCTWSAATDHTNEYDLTVLAYDHMKKYPACPGVNFSRTLIRC